MNIGIESIEAVTAASLNEPSFIKSEVEPCGAFANLMLRSIGDVNADVTAAETAMRGLASGKPVELHEVMISLEQARLSVQTFIQIRNKLIESYQDVMRMQM
jgi:flagellar hook-basal body complex protein FliE